MEVWIQCDEYGNPYFPSASKDRFKSRALLIAFLFKDECIQDARNEGWTEKRFVFSEVDDV